MLRSLSIGNVALIDQLDMTFYDGFSVLTGETGAGKSIIIEAFNFVLGERASRELIKSGAQKASVEALFTLAEGDPAAAVLTRMDLMPEDGELTLYRELSAAGKNVCRCNGTLISAAMLKEIGDALVDIHGQHAHQALLNPKLHLPMLDAFSGREAATLLKSTAEAYRRASAAGKQLHGAEMDERERQRRIDLLSYQIKEIDEAQLLEGEEDALEEERRLQQNAQSVMEALETGAETLSGEEGVLSGLNGALRALDGIAAYQKEYGEVTERIRDAYYALEDASYTLRDLRSGFTYDPERLDQIEWRLEQISTLKRKYGDGVTEILDYREKSAAELELLSTVEERREALQKEYDEAVRQYASAAEALSALRRGAAERLSERLLPELSDLGMPYASFSVDFARLPGDAPGPAGFDQAEFLLSANKGEPVKPLSKVASGGELSRIMLAFKSVLAETDGIPTMVFDEIDTGISGQVGTAVAVKMRGIARRHQVLCITHLPQIAAFANKQYLVYKETEGERTSSHAALLTGEERVLEIARIMGGGAGDAAAVDHARSLIRQAEERMAAE